MRDHSNSPRSLLYCETLKMNRGQHQMKLGKFLLNSIQESSDVKAFATAEIMIIADLLRHSSDAPDPNVKPIPRLLKCHNQPEQIDCSVLLA